MKNKKINLFFKNWKRNYWWRWKHDNMVAYRITLKWKLLNIFLNQMHINKMEDEYFCRWYGYLHRKKV